MSPINAVTDSPPIPSKKAIPDNIRSPYRLSLVIPAWNEADTIPQAISEAEATLAALTDDYEILVVDDGSTDQTAERTHAAVIRNPRVRLLVQPRNSGYGAALRTGFQAARFELVAFTDADCQFDLDDLKYLLPLTARFDVVCGQRVDRQDPPLRRFCSWGYNTVVRLLLGSPVHDVDCALKIFRRERLPALLPETDDFFVNTEMLTKARLQGLSIVEAGVQHRPRAAGTSKVSLGDIPRTLGALLPFWWSKVLFPASAAPVEAPGRVWPGLLFLMLLAAALLFPHLTHPLLDPDESRYSEIPREMLVRGDFVLPTLNFEPYYDKPPLLYWLCAASFQLFGKQEWAARLVPAGAAFLTVLISYLFAARILGRGAAFCGALVLTLSVGFIFCGRFLVLDSVLSLFVTAALCSAHLALEGDRLRPGWWIASAVCCGLGVLTKGPIACVLFAPPVLAHAWLSGSRVRPTRRQWLAFGGLVTLVAAPWFLAIMLRDPNFARYFFWEHHVSRFAGAFHARPVWFFIPVLLAGGLPWSLLAIPFCRFLCSRAPELRALRPRQLGFLVLWAGWNFCFFSASKCKLPPYILPAAPALALLLGYFLDRVVLTVPLQLKFFRGLGELPRHASGTLCVTGIVLSPVAYFLGMTHLTGALFYACFWAICLAGVRAYARQLSVQAAWALCGLLAYVTICDTTQRLVPAWAEQQNLLAARGPVTQLLADEQTAVVSYLREWSAVPFYLERNDIRNFTNYEIPALSEFLTAHPRTVMLMKPTLDPEKLGIVLPAGSRMSRIVETPQAALVLVEVPAGAAAPAKLTGN